MPHFNAFAGGDTLPISGRRWEVIKCESAEVRKCESAKVNMYEMRKFDAKDFAFYTSPF